MEQKTNIGKISSVPIIGIQHEVITESGETAIHVEYFVINQDKFLESMDDPEDESLIALLVAVNLGSLLLADLRSSLPSENHLNGMLFNDLKAKTFYDAMGVVLDSDIVGEVVRYKVSNSWKDIITSPGVN